MTTRTEKPPLTRSQKRQRRRNRFRLVSTAIGLIIGLLSFVSSYAFAAGVFQNPKGNPIDIAFWFLLYGIMVLLGSFFVYTRQLVPVGAVLILLPSLLIGPQSIATIVPGSDEFKANIGLILGWILPVISFGLALLSIQRESQSTVESKDKRS
jgi:hypothetical protein